MKFKFITFEGIEGCGKSTQAKKLNEFLLANKVPTLLTREPGGTLAGEKIREILIDENIKALEIKTELLLNFASRLEHIEKLIKPALQESKVVISDRFIDSTYAYQGYAFGLNKKLIDEVRNLIIQDFTPEITFLIDVPVELAFSRIKNRINNNRYEKLDLDFHHRVRNGFLDMAKENPRIKIVDGTRDQEEIFQEILSIIK